MLNPQNFTQVEGGLLNQSSKVVVLCGISSEDPLVTHITYFHFHRLSFLVECWSAMV